MVPLARSRSLFGVVFLLGLLALAVWNAWLYGPSVAVAARTDVTAAGVVGDNRFVRIRLAAENMYFGKDASRTIRGALARATGKREMDNFAVIRGPDGVLYPGGLYALDTEPARRLADAMEDLAAIAAETGSGLVYLAVPDLVIKGSPLPAGMPVLDYNGALDTLLYNLRQRAVPTLDTRSIFLTGRYPTDALRARTAPLLTGCAMFAVHTTLAEALRLDENGFYTDMANYHVQEYPRFFLGMMGHRTGPVFAGLDDFTTISPAFPTDFSIQALDRFRGDVTLRGSALETLFRPEALTHRESLYSFYPESFYAHSTIISSDIVNHERTEGPKILLIHDFYTAPLASFLAPLAREVTTLSVDDGQTGHADALVRDRSYDIVVVSLFPATLLRPGVVTILVENFVPRKNRSHKAF